MAIKTTFTNLSKQIESWMALGKFFNFLSIPYSFATMEIQQTIGSWSTTKSEYFQVENA